MRKNYLCYFWSSERNMFYERLIFNLDINPWNKQRRMCDT